MLICQRMIPLTLLEVVDAIVFVLFENPRIVQRGQRYSCVRLCHWVICMAMCVSRKSVCLLQNEAPEKVNFWDASE